jgi:hypothetical protein
VSRRNGEGGGGAEDGKEEEDGKAHGGMPCEYLGMEEPSMAEFQISICIYVGSTMMQPKTALVPAFKP